MLTRREVLQVPGLTLLLSAARAASSPARRTLLVGIDEYIPTENIAAAGGALRRQNSSFVKRNREIPNLAGAVNDATLMAQILKDRLGFPPQNVVLLINQQATRNRILHEFQRLIDSSSPGDTALFFYAGHGSQVTNLASDEADQKDETLVPADAYSGTPDIRDKEMARLYRSALKKGLLLTVVFDSCNSGGMARGLWNSAGKTRNAPPDTQPINDPPDVDPLTGKKLPDPTELGMLFLAAARKDQSAHEVIIEDRAKKEVVHGAFTAALVRVLQSQAASQSVEQICERVQAILASEGTSQVPICGGIDRKIRGLTGQALSLPASITVSVESIPREGFARVRGGSALGLAAGCTFSHIGAGPARLELVSVQLATSEAKILASPSTVQVGDVFKLETWTAPPDSRLKLCVHGNLPDAAALQSTALEIERLNGQNSWQVVYSPRPEEPPTHVLIWKNGSYFLDFHPRQNEAIHLGSSPTAEQIMQAVAGRKAVRVWPILPPSRQFASALHLGDGTQNPVVQLVTDPAEATYFLAGQYRQNTIEYSWIFRDVLNIDLNQLRLPLGTDASSTPEKLTELALRLARIYAWLNMDGPAGGDAAFPYRLVLQNAETRLPAGPGPFKFGEKYKILFEANASALTQAMAAGGPSKRYVYVFVIDSNGEAVCLFPRSARGNVENLLPRAEEGPRIIATPVEYDLQISEPAGTDNYFMVASEQPIDPGVFEWTGVRRREARGTNPLELLFASVGNETRGAQPPPRNVPLHWSMQSMAVRSIPPR